MTSPTLPRYIRRHWPKVVPTEPTRRQRKVRARIMRIAKKAGWL